MHTAFVLGAGLGTRLRPLTNRRPKPLIPLGNRPLITWAFDHLMDAGVRRFVVNTHWRAERYAEFFPDGHWRGCPLHFIEETPEVLETGGGIWNARELLSDGPFIVYNGDILSDLPLAQAIEHHRAFGNEVTLILRSTGENRNVTFDAESGRVLDLRRTLRPELTPSFLFTGIYLVEPAFIARIPAAQKISVVPVFHEMIRLGAKLGGIVLDEGNWRDLGTREEYLAADRSVSGTSNTIHPSATIGAGALLEDCIVWENATVAAGANLTRCIVADRAHASGVATDRDFEAE
jgi:mannose-1-phosphate guanylyltransferase